MKNSQKTYYLFNVFIMKQINCKALIKEVGTNRTWTESFSAMVKDDVDEIDYCRWVVESFNNSLKPNEHPREILHVRNSSIKGPILHNWKKKSIVTEKGGYDIYQCSNCGALGKRHGLSSTVVADKKFTAFCKIK